MMTAKGALCAGFVATALGMMAAAPAQADSNTKAVLGIQMTFGNRVAPELFTGVVHADKSSSSHYTGAKALVYWDFTQGPMPDKFKVVALTGPKHIQAEVGAGYSFSQSSPFFTGGVSGNHLTAGVDFSPSAGLAPYVGVQTPRYP